MTAKIEELREAPTQITSSEAIVLLAKPHLEGTGTEDKFLDCLERELVGEAVSAGVADRQRAGKEFAPRSSLSDGPFQIYADHHFVDALYPWLEPSTAPANAQGFSAFLARPGVSDRVNEMGVRFIVWIDGVTQKTDGGGSIACAAGPGGAGCLGLGWWEKTSDYEATIWDLKQGVSAGSLSDRRQRHVRHDRRNRADSIDRARPEHRVRSTRRSTQVFPAWDGRRGHGSGFSRRSSEFAGARARGSKR